MNRPLVGPIDAVRIKGQVFAFIANDETGGRLVPVGGNADEMHLCVAYQSRVGGVRYWRPIKVTDPQPVSVSFSWMKRSSDYVR